MGHPAAPTTLRAGLLQVSNSSPKGAHALVVAGEKEEEKRGALQKGVSHHSPQPQQQAALSVREMLRGVRLRGSDTVQQAPLDSSNKSSTHQDGERSLYQCTLRDFRGEHLGVRGK